MTEVTRDEFWEGFEACLEMVLNSIRQGDFFQDDETANLFAEEIIDEAELYKKDG